MFKKIFRWVPWLVIVGLVLYMIFVPVKGIIGLVDLPRDDAFLPQEDVQWWYWTGHLETDEGRKFGFEVVFFTFDSFLVFKDQLVQGAITDVQDNSFHFKEYVRTFSLPDRTENFFYLKSDKTSKITAEGGNGHDMLHSEIDGYTLDLKLDETKKPTVHYDGGPHPYRFGGFTYYYSRESMQTKGTLTVGGKTYNVHGTSWFDRQYGELYQAISKGWQWFAIELKDNRQLMLYDIKGNENHLERYASVTDAKGKTENLGPDEFTVDILGEWKSPDTGCTYPSGWKVGVGNEEWIVQPMVKDQELQAEHHFWVGPKYWEGACTVSSPGGAMVGKAYVELNGYCRNKL